MWKFIFRYITLVSKKFKASTKTMSSMRTVRFLESHCLFYILSQPVLPMLLSKLHWLSRPATLLKRDTNTDVFLSNLKKFLRAPIMKNIWERLFLNGLALDLKFSICLQQRDRTAPPSILREKVFSDFSTRCFCSEWSDEKSQEINFTR